jgi:hypothetical protein
MKMLMGWEGVIGWIDRGTGWEDGEGCSGKMFTASAS